MTILYTLLGIAAMVVILALGRAALTVLGALISRFAGPMIVLSLIFAAIIINHIASMPHAYGL